MKKFNILFYIVLLSLSLLITEKIVAQPQHFHPCWEGQQPFSPMNIYIIGTKLNGQNLTTNDEICIFDGNLCVGAGVVTGTISSTAFLEIIASKDDGISGLGFTEGHKILFKIWIASNNQEVSLEDSEIQFHDQQTGNPINPVPFSGLGSAVVSLEGTTNGLQQHFHPCWEGQQPFSPMNIYIIGAKLNGQNLTTNDEIGIFDGNLCVGAGVVTGTISSTAFLEIIASKDDGISGLGFIEGHKILFKIWIASDSKELSLKDSEVQFHDQQTGNPINPVPFSGLGTAVVSLEGTEITEFFYKAKKLPDGAPLPTIDGIPDEFFWSLIKADTLQFGGIHREWNSPWTNWNDNLVIWKAVWSSVSNKLYVAIIVNDDIRGTFDNNNPADILFQPWNDECIEIFTDGNNNGGYYEGTYDKAQQWFITGENKIILDDHPTSSQYTLYTGTDLVTALTTGLRGEWICEGELNIYDVFPTSRTTLKVGDTIGWNIWYDDTDNLTISNGRYVRDHQIGWQYTGPADSNADYFGNIILETDLNYILVNSPNGGEYWRVGSPQTITWTSHNVTGNIKIEISTDAGISWTTIANSTSNTGSYSWLPTAAYISNNCLIKIASLSDPSIFDQSDATFMISNKDKVDLWIDTDLSGTHGDTIKIPIHSSDLTGLYVYSAAITISCDGNVLEILDIDIAGTILQASGWGPPTKNISFGRIKLAMAGSSPLAGSGILINIVGKINGNENDSTILHFDNATFNEGDPVVLTSDGLLKVTAGYDIKGQLGYYKDPAIAVSNASVLLTGAAIQISVSNSIGNYEFLNLPSGNYTVTAAKNNDVKGAITPYDASLILRYNVGAATLTPYQKIASDVSGNGDVTSFDASWILRYCVGSVTSFPVGADWTFVPHDFPINDTNWPSSPRSRSYTPLQSHKLVQNFMSILYGDVSGNWSGARETSSSVTVDLELGNIQQLNNGKWQVPLQIQFFNAAYSGSFQILFDNIHFQFESASIGNVTTNLISETSTSDGKLYFAFASGQSLNSQILELNFIFKGLTSTMLSPSDITIQNVVIDDNSAIITSIKKDSENKIPANWQLSQNQPNPFNAETSICYQVPKFSHIKIEIFNLIGQRLRTIINEEKKPGTYEAIWDGMDDQNRSVGSGIYIYRMSTGEFTAIKKMVLVQ